METIKGKLGTFLVTTCYGMSSPGGGELTKGADSLFLGWDKATTGQWGKTVSSLFHQSSSWGRNLGLRYFVAAQAGSMLSFHYSQTFNLETIFSAGAWHPCGNSEIGHLGSQDKKIFQGLHLRVVFSYACLLLKIPRFFTRFQSDSKNRKENSSGVKGWVCQLSV